MLTIQTLRMADAQCSMLGKEGESDSEEEEEDDEDQPRRRGRGAPRERASRPQKRQELRDDIVKAAGGVPLSGKD